MIPALTSAALARGAATTTIGSSRLGAPNAGICALEGAAGAERSCTDAQLPGGAKSIWESGFLAPFDGTIVSWKVLSGPATPATLAASLRLRTIDSSSGAGGGHGEFVSLPLDQPGTHVFPTHLPVRAHERIGVDSIVTSRGGGVATVPIARLGGGVAAGHVQEWSPPLIDGFESTALGLAEGSELLLSAEIEPERIPPRTKLTYAGRQDFLGARSAVVRLRSSEDATAIASGQVEWPRAGHRGRVVYGLFGVKRKTHRGEKTTLRLRVPRQSRGAARRALALGKRVVAKITVSAVDAAGNESGKTVATIRPRRR